MTDTIRALEALGIDLPQTAAEARACGSRLYFTGKPCPKGHITPKYTKQHRCTECNRGWTVAYRVDHPNYLHDYNREWARQNSKKNAESTLKFWRSLSPEERLERSRRYFRARYDRNPELTKEQLRRHEQVRRAREVGAEGHYTLAEWEMLKEIYGHKCLACGRSSDERPLTVDHVVPLIEGGSNTIDNIQPLCKPCNSAKHTKTIDYRTMEVANVG